MNKIVLIFINLTLPFCWRKNKDVIPIYTIHDKIEEYDGSEIICGEYFVEGIELKVNTFNRRKFMVDNCFRNFFDG